MIVTTIAEVTSKRDEDAAIQKSQGATLILSTRIKVDAARAKLCSNIDRKAGQDAAVGKPQAVDEVPRRATVIDHRVEIYGAAARIDYRRSRDTKRIDIATGECRSGNRVAECSAPCDPSSISVQRIDEVTLGCGDNQSRSDVWGPPKQWLGVDVSLDIAVERLDAVDSACGLPSEARNDVIACAVRRTVIKWHRYVGWRCAESWRSDKHQNQNQANHRIAPIQEFSGWVWRSDSTIPGHPALR
jgi:hypothetical protein